MSKKQALIEIAKTLIWLVTVLSVFLLLTAFVNIWCGLIGLIVMAIITWKLYAS